ncbi:adenylosuccinate synthetase, partial [Staphylococcus epidermidis]|uniref:adenylosuccinate synthetase n=1 Tax=Staphylococcus epidermidis TaxID=1282 RepID=UPI0016430228
MFISKFKIIFLKYLLLKPQKLPPPHISSILLLPTQSPHQPKTKITHFLPHQPHLIPTFSPPNNPPHTIQFPPQTYKLHLLPSPIFYKHKLPLIPNPLLLHPLPLLK